MPAVSVTSATPRSAESSARRPRAASSSTAMPAIAATWAPRDTVRKSVRPSAGTAAMAAIRSRAARRASEAVWIASIRPIDASAPTAFQ
jgi:hypothetical protein